MKILSLLNGRILAIMFALTSLIFVSSCGDDDGGDDTPAPTQTAYEIISGDANLSEFKTRIDADSTLKAWLQGADAYTVFAPNNAAFERLRTNLGVTDLSTITPDIIGSVLRYHFLSGTKTSTELKGGSATTQQGEKITISTTGLVKDAGTNTEGSEILKADQMATNGVVHELETALIPPLLFLKIGITLGTLAQPILLGYTFTDIVGIIEIADSSVPTGETKISDLLADKNKQYTAFMPINDLLAGIAASQEISKEALIASVTTTNGAADPAKARAFLLNHIHDGGKLLAADLTNGSSFTMMGGKALTVLVVDASGDTPTGCTNFGTSCIFLAGDVNDPLTYVPVIATDVYSANDADGNAIGSAVNGSLHVSSIIQ